MYVSPFSETPKWFTIPCNEPVDFPRLDFICENKTIGKIVMNMTWTLSESDLFSSGCEGRSLSKCLPKALLMMSLIRCQKTIKVVNIMGKISIIQLPYSFKKIDRHSKEDVSFMTQDNSDCVVLFQLSFPPLRNLPAKKWTHTKCFSFSNVSHVLCKMDKHNNRNISQHPQCTQNQFKCLDGSCIPIHMSVMAS